MHTCYNYEHTKQGLRLCHSNYCKYVFDESVSCPIKRIMARRKDGTRIFPNG